MVRAPAAACAGRMVQQPGGGTRALLPAADVHKCAVHCCRILASLYNGHVYIWNYAEQVCYWPRRLLQCGQQRQGMGAAERVCYSWHCPAAGLSSSQCRICRCLRLPVHNA